MAITGMILGILSVIFFWIPLVGWANPWIPLVGWAIALIMAAVGLLLSIVGFSTGRHKGFRPLGLPLSIVKTEAARRAETRANIAVVGIVLNLVDLVTSAIVVSFKPELLNPIIQMAA